MAQTLSTETTRKISFMKIARAALAEVRVHKKLAIITYVLYGVALLLFLFNSEVSPSISYGQSEELLFYPSGWGIFFALCGAVVSFFTVLNVFRDMNNQQICDVSMALPIKASERFLSKLLSLFYIQILPQLVSILGGNGIRLLIGRMMYGDLPGNGGEVLSEMVFSILAGTMFVMSITVLCVCCCGAPAESSYFSIILMGIINALPLCFIFYLVNGCAGFYCDPSDVTLFDYKYWGFLFLADPSDKPELHCSVGCVISLAVMLLSGLIYIRRDAKTVGMPIASRVFFEMTMTLGCVTVFLFFIISGGTLWGLLIAAVAYIIINIIVSRAKINVLSFLKWGGKYLITAAAFTAVAIAAIKTGGFGYIGERPAAEYLDGAEFNIYFYDRALNFDRSYELRTEALTSEQADKMMSICKKHIINGRAHINPFDVFLGNIYSSVVTIRADSSKEYFECPYPRSQFRQNYRTDKYYLQYEQGLAIPSEDLSAMIQELKNLDFVYEYVDNENVDTEIVN